MSLFETEAIVLKSYNLAEADKIVILLTQSNGIIRGVAKGAKRLKSRFGGGLEPFTIVRLSYFQKEEKELVSIRQIDLIKSYFQIASEPACLQRFAYLAELLIEFSPPHNPDENLFRMARVCLGAASNDLQALESITLYFELWMLRLGGYLPSWNSCSLCNRQLKNERAGLQSNSQLICLQCVKVKSSLAISPQEIEVYAAAQRVAPSGFIAYAADKNPEVRKISQILKRIIAGVLGKEILSEKCLIVNS